MDRYIGAISMRLSDALKKMQTQLQQLNGNYAQHESVQGLLLFQQAILPSEHSLPSNAFPWAPHEQHDFFLASQRPWPSPVLLQQSRKYHSLRQRRKIEFNNDEYVDAQDDPRPLPAKHQMGRPCPRDNLLHEQKHRINPAVTISKAQDSIRISKGIFAMLRSNIMPLVFFSAWIRHLTYSRGLLSSSLPLLCCTLIYWSYCYHSTAPMEATYSSTAPMAATCSSTTPMDATYSSHKAALNRRGFSHGNREDLALKDLTQRPQVANGSVALTTVGSGNGGVLQNVHGGFCANTAVTGAVQRAPILTSKRDDCSKITTAIKALRQSQSFPRPPGKLGTFCTLATLTLFVTPVTSLVPEGGNVMTIQQRSTSANGRVLGPLVTVGDNSNDPPISLSPLPGLLYPVLCAFLLATCLIYANLKSWEPTYVYGTLAMVSWWLTALLRRDESVSPWCLWS